MPNEPLPQEGQTPAPEIPQTPFNAQPTQTSAPTPNPPAVSEAPISQPTPFGLGSEAQPQATAQAPKKKHKGLIITIIVVAFLALLATSAALAYNFIYQNPEKVVTDSLMKAITAETIAGNGTVVAKNDTITIKVGIDGGSDGENGKLKASLDISSDDREVKLDGEGVFAKNGDLFLKVNNADELVQTLMEGSGSTSTALDGLIEKVDGQWIKISNDELGTYSETYEKSKKCVDDALGSAQNDKSLNKEISDLYRANSFIIVKDKLGSKTINGVESLGYEIEGDAAKAKAFISGIKETQLGKKLITCDDSFDFDSLAEGLDSSSVDGTYKVQLWASRFGHELTELNVNGKNDDTDVSVVFHPIFNKTVEVEIPTDTISLEELQTEITNTLSQLYMQSYNTVDMTKTKSSNQNLFN